MGFYDKHILPHVINSACGAGPIEKQRQKVVPLAEGRVLEVGIGTGLNLPFYDAARVTRVFGLDPSEESFRLARKRVENIAFELEYLPLAGDQIPLEDDSVDTALITYTLCTIADAQAALEGVRRVLKPRGRLIFCEHGRAPDEAVRRWQDRLNGLWGVIGGGCNLNRDIPALITGGGFAIEQLDTMYLPSTPKFGGFNYWGTARPR